MRPVETDLLMGKDRIQPGDFEIAVNDYTKLPCKKRNEKIQSCHKLWLEIKAPVRRLSIYNSRRYIFRAVRNYLAEKLS